MERNCKGVGRGEREGRGNEIKWCKKSCNSSRHSVVAGEVYRVNKLWREAQPAGLPAARDRRD